jgi:anti-anti-sigma factor
MPSGNVGSVGRTEDGVRIEFCGSIDAQSITTIAIDVRRAIKSAHGDPVIFDFTGVSFIDSVGIGWLLSFRNMPEERGQVRLVLPRDTQPARILTLLHIDRSLPIMHEDAAFV